MKKKILYTTIFFLPTFLLGLPGPPRFFAPISSLKQGPDGIFGICLSTAFETENSDYVALSVFFF